MRFHNRFQALAVGGMIGVLTISQAVPSTQAQTTNITSSGLGTKITQVGNTYNIEGGTRPLSSSFSTARLPGPNVFHSFGRFDLGAGNIANFIRPDAAATTVISRVTGGVPSNINGTIQALGWSNFYFVNPSGVVFGPSATLNVSGSVYINTAHYMKFSDGGVFSTRPGTVGTELLSSSPVSSFGFLQGVSAAPITITGSKLSLGSGQTLSVVGGSITIDGAQLSAPNGKVQVASVGGTSNGQPVSYQTVEIVPAHDTVEIVPAFDTQELGIEGECCITVHHPATRQIVHHPESTVTNSYSLGSGGEVSANDVRSINNLTLGNITMNPGSSFAALDAGPNGTVVTNPAAASIQTPAGSQKIVLPSLVKVETASTLSGTTLTPTVELGLSGTFTVALNKASPTDTTVNVSSLNSDVATVTTTVTIPAGQLSSGPIAVTGIRVGTVTIRAALGGTFVDKSMQVTPMSLISLSGVSILEGQSGTATITLPRVAPSTVTVTLTTSNPNIATVETSVNIPAGQRSAPVTVRGVTEGSVQLRAQSGNSTQTAAVVVNALPPPPLSSLSPNLSLKVGNSGSIAVVLTETFKKDLTVLLKSSDSSIASVNESVTIPANSTTSQPVVVTANGAGRTTIIATLLNSSVQASVDVSSVAVAAPQSTPDIAGASQTIVLAAAAQYPRTLAAPQGSVTVPKLLADKCAAMKDGQFSSFAQLNRDSAPAQPGRYLSSPTLLEGDPITGARETVPEISIMVGPPKVLTVHPDVMSFIALAQDCRLEVK